MSKAWSRYVREEECIYGLGGNPEGKRPLGRPRSRWEENIKNVSH
jgi:hypothetical protein